MFHMTAHELLVYWRDTVVVITWCVAILYLLSGAQDLFYDLWGYYLRIYRRIRYRNNQRLTLERLRLRAQQRIAIWVPAWQEADVVDRMVENILHRVEYSNYTIFVGAYANDLETQRAIEVLASAHPQIIKVVLQHDGPTNKADCLNHIHKAMKTYEHAHDVRFAIVVIHDAEDVVHPYSLLLYNYLLPRVDVVQLPILPLPAPWYKLVHWSYGDEFAENHMKDVMVREKMGGFVPYAGVGTGFTRRAILLLEERYGDKIFNESSMTEDYSLSKRASAAGLQSIFVNLLLADDGSPWFKPLSGRPGFIANWSYFPMDFWRAVRQKTRWMIGISLQEWKFSGWRGNLQVKENLFKDRKIFLSAFVTLLAYVAACYFVLYELGEHGILPFQWLPLIFEGTPLYTLVMICTGLMLLRMLQRLIFVTMVYGLPAGVFSLPRIVFSNILNGYTAFRALFIFLASLRGRPVLWDKTDHTEGVGEMPNGVLKETNGVVNAHTSSKVEDLKALHARDPWQIVTALERLTPDCSSKQQSEITAMMLELAAHPDHHVRAANARAIGTLGWEELAPAIGMLLTDREWVVRANAAMAVLRLPNLPALVRDLVPGDDRYARQVLIRTIEQDERAMSTLLARLDDPEMATVRTILLEQSELLRDMYRAQSEIARENDRRVDVVPV